MLQTMCARDCCIAAVHAQAQLSRAFLGRYMYNCLHVDALKQLAMLNLKNAGKLLKPYGCNMQTPIYLVVETSGSNAEHDYAKLEKFLEEAYEEEIIVDGTIAQDSGQQASIWALRENISEGLRHAGTPVTAAPVTAAAAAVTAAVADAVTAAIATAVTAAAVTTAAAAVTAAAAAVTAATAAAVTPATAAAVTAATAVAAAAIWGSAIVVIELAV